jgi:hypothetical protein
MAVLRARAAPRRLNHDRQRRHARGKPTKAVRLMGHTSASAISHRRSSSVSTSPSHDHVPRSDKVEQFLFQNFFSAIEAAKLFSVRGQNAPEILFPRKPWKYAAGFKDLPVRNHKLWPGVAGNWIGVPVYTGRGFAITNGSKPDV